ncbi:threonine synthase [Flavobacteriaceae bacterium MAR_2010_188]|nr:threonine synthase [Flavobacteriaceae bacterium MAR_2010_188]
MKYHSLNEISPETTFKDAVIRGIAPDKGLYFPDSITPLSTEFWESLGKMNNQDIALEAIRQFVEPDIPEDILKEIISETLSFDFPVVNLSKNISSLELFHGPTMAFKDVGAKFMAKSLEYFNQDNEREVTVLVATSGDTGGAVANGFLNAKGVKVVILYPSGKVSDIQEKQLTTLGANITALEVNGVFDDCQDMVKNAFLDSELTDKMQLTSANSINVARWLPQMFYFIFAYKRVRPIYKDIVFSVPSGNFGNICAGMVAQKLGMPVKHFIASNNDNNVVTNYLKSGEYTPKPSVATISNAMDVGNPSNFIRIQKLFNNELADLKSILSSYSFSDSQTKVALKEIREKYDYVADPHGAVGYLGAKAYLEEHPYAHCVFLETAHPTKFLDVVESVLNEKIELPPQIQKVMGKEKVSVKISSYNELKEFLLKS